MVCLVQALPFKNIVDFRFADGPKGMASETSLQEPVSLLMEHTWQEGGEENMAESGFMEKWRVTPGFNDMATIGDMLDVPAEIDWVSYVLVPVIERAFTTTQCCNEALDRA